MTGNKVTYLFLFFSFNTYRGIRRRAKVKLIPCLEVALSEPESASTCQAHHGLPPRADLFYSEMMSSMQTTSSPCLETSPMLYIWVIGKEVAGRV